MADPYVRHRALIERIRLLWARSSSRTPRTFDAAIGRADRALACKCYVEAGEFVDIAEKVLRDNDE